MRKRILIAEDEETTNELLSCIAERLGYDVVSVGNGVELLSTLARERFDAVITDNVMPLVSGVSAAELLKARGDSTPVVALTAMSQDELGADAEIFTRVFYKPCDVRVLFRYVQTLTA